MDEDGLGRVVTIASLVSGKSGALDRAAAVPRCAAVSHPNTCQRQWWQKQQRPEVKFQVVIIAAFMQLQREFRLLH